MRVDVERALRSVRLKKKSNFLTLPELLRALTHLIGNGRVLSVSWSPDSKFLASASMDKTVRIWDASTGQCQSPLSVDSGIGGVQSLSYSPGGDMIAAGCYNGKIHILDTVTVAVKRSLSGHSDR